MDVDCAYPDDEELKRIEEWPWSDVEGLLAFVGERWRYARDGFLRQGDDLELHTFGWSGNEELVNALQANFMFWQVCWESTRRGGHYHFRIRRMKGRQERYEKEKAN